MDIEDLDFKKYYFNQRFGWNYWKSMEFTTYRKTTHGGFISVYERYTTYKDSCTTEFPLLIESIKALQDEFPSAMCRIRTKENRKEESTTAWIDLKFFSNGDDAHFSFLYYKEMDHNVGYDAKSIAILNSPWNPRPTNTFHSPYMPISSITLPNPVVGQQVYVHPAPGIAMTATPAGAVTLSSSSGSLTIV